jgi:hypothetical protein
MTFPCSGHDFSRRQHVSRREEIDADSRIGTSLPGSGHSITTHSAKAVAPRRGRNEHSCANADRSLRGSNRYQRTWEIAENRSWRRMYWEGVAGERLGPLTTTHRVRAPPTCTQGYAAALSKGNRAFALRGSRSNRGARTTGATAGRTLERPATSLKNRMPPMS